MWTDERTVFWRNQRRGPVRRRSAHQACCAAMVVAAVTFFAVPRAMAQSAVPEGVWLIDKKAAVQIFDCQALMCGRVLWMYKPRNAQGVLNQDIHNPDPAPRKRPFCGLTMLSNLHPDGPNAGKKAGSTTPTTARPTASRPSSSPTT